MTNQYFNVRHEGLGLLAVLCSMAVVLTGCGNDSKRVQGASSSTATASSYAEPLVGVDGSASYSEGDFGAGIAKEGTGVLYDSDGNVVGGSEESSIESSIESSAVENSVESVENFEVSSSSEMSDSIEVPSSSLESSAVETESSEVESTETEDAELVYFSKSSVTYHKYKNCSGLAGVMQVDSGTVEEALEKKKSIQCGICYK